jgi:hypothetical protein
VTSYVLSPNIPLNTIFSSGSGLSVLPFTTSYKMTPDPGGDGTNSEGYMINTFNLMALINGNNVDITMQVYDHTALSDFRGFILLYKQALINSLYPSALFVGPYHLFNNNNNYNMSTVASAFGPPFN